MERIAYILKLRHGTGLQYDEAHRHVWPEMLELLKQAGISEYSIFRRDDLLFLYLRAEDAEKSWKLLDNHPVNQRWQKAMAKYFDPIQPMQDSERFPMLREVFYLK